MADTKDPDMSRTDFEHPEELLPWVANGTLEGDELRRVEEHLASCLTCRQEVQRLESLRGLVKDSIEDSVREASETLAGSGSAGPPGGDGLDRLMAALDLPEAAEPETERRAEPDERSDPKVVPFRRPLRGIPRPLLALAALLAVALAVQVYRTLDVATPPPIVRGEEDAALRSQIPEGETMPRGAFELTWEAAEPWQDATFSVYLTTADLRAVYEARGLDAARVAIPAETFDDVPPGAKLLWRIEAVRPDGASQRSKTFVVVLE